MNRSASPGFPPGPIPVATTENLLGIRGAVDHDGGTAFFDVAFTNQHAFRASVPFEVMPLVLAEINAASTAMLRRQSLQLDKGAAALLELCEAALRPASVDVVVDPRTHDRLFIHHFFHQAPVVFRVSPLDTQRNMSRVAVRLRQMLH
jgi:hypothetical protein